MGTNLRDELEPLLTKLWDAARSAYLASPVFPDADSPAAQDSQKAFDEELSLLVLRFGNYLSLDGPDLDTVWSEFAGGSVYCSVARAMGALELSVAAKALADGVRKAKESVVWICKDAIQRFGGGGTPGPKGVSGWVAILADAVAFATAAESGSGFAEWVEEQLSGVPMILGLIEVESRIPGNEDPIEIGTAPSPMGTSTRPGWR